MKPMSNRFRIFAALPGVLIFCQPFYNSAIAAADGAKESGKALRAPAAPPQKTTSLGLPSITPGSAEEIKALLAKAPKASDYPNAASAMLLDLMDVVVKPDGSSVSVTRQAKKIFTKRGRDDESEIKIPYNAAFESVRIIRARTIKPDGSVVNIKKEDIRESRPSDYDDVVVKAFSLPAVDDDCIIDYEYVTESKESQMPGQFWQSWYFQGGFDPVMKTKLTVTVPKNVKLHENISNSPVKATVKALPDGKNVLYTWEDNNVAPFETEPLMPDTDKLVPKLYLSTVPSWQAVADWYSDLAKDRMNADAALKAQTQTLIQGKTTPEEKARAIFYYVQEKTRYVAISLGKSAYQPRPASLTYANKYGDCKDMATLLVAMLREAGISAYPVLIKMDSKDKRSAELPSPGAFNHAICKAEINGKDYWLDATAAVCPWGVIPGVDRGCEVMVIKDGKGVWETIPFGEPEDNRFERTVKLTLAPDGSATGTIAITGNGDTDMALRSSLRDWPESKRRLYAENLALSVGANPRVTDVSVSDYKDMTAPVTLKMDVSFPSWANQSGDLLIFKAKPEQTGGVSSNPFREDFRKNNIVQNSFSMASTTLDLTLPKDHVVLSLPKDANIKSDLGQFTRVIKQDGDKLNIVVSQKVLRADIPFTRYDEVRKYFGDFLKAVDESVILKKR